ncbi:MAG: S8/S53 family peptidase [Chloroflexi bacterium]|nr:S8/S53 family peptidase [Chloroflexota bacterium]
MHRAFDTSPEALGAAATAALGDRGRVHPKRRQPIAFEAVNGGEGLGFVFVELDGVESPVATHDAIDTLDAELARHESGLSLMPHWYTAALVGPASLPRPLRPSEVPEGASAYHYRPPPRLDLARRAGARAARRISLVALDTAPHWDEAEQLAVGYLGNHGNQQLSDLVFALHPRTASALPELAGEGPLDSRGRLDPNDARFAMPDHGLFVAGLIHELAPNVPLRLLRVLDDSGIGDLWSLLRGLRLALDAVSPLEPLVVNLSLGLMPQPDELLRYWFGPPLTPRLDLAWLRAHRAEALRRIARLHAGLEQLVVTLQHRNCLLVAGVGDDSASRVAVGQARLGPRLPARYDAVLGVAGVRSDPSLASRSSNAGDPLELGSDVAAFGGDVDRRDEPEEGVIGVYASPRMPGDRAGQTVFPRLNRTGWARWSGTSFSTALVSGLAANLWAAAFARGQVLTASEVLPYVVQAVAATGPRVPPLRTFGLRLVGNWRA